MQITFVRSNTNAVGEYRVHHPMLALQAMGHDCRQLLLDQQGVRVCNSELVGDILVLQRQTSPDILALWETLPEGMRPILVYELDDNPWEWHSTDSVHRELGANYAKHCSAVMGRCAAVTCSTRRLAERVRREFPAMPIWVIPNAIDYSNRDWEAREDRTAHGLEDRTVLGWTGSIHHTQDAGPMLNALPEVFERYPETVFLMQCCRSVYNAWTPALQEGWGDRLRWVPPLAFAQHPSIYSLFDINLAPLATTSFNLCKSDLRLIEGGAHGVPYVASDIAPYREFHTASAGIGGHLAHTTGEWVGGISKLLDREDVARGESLRRYVRETRALSVVAGQWETAYRSVLDGAPGQVAQSPPPPGRNDRCPCESGRKYKRCCEPAYG